MLIELRDSWFSPKCVEAQPSVIHDLGVKHCFGTGCENGTKSWQTKNTKPVPWMSETVRDKLHCREGNSPDPQLRPLNND